MGLIPGNVYVAYHRWNNGNADANIRCATSTDQGLTWTQNVLVNDDTNLSDQVMPGIAVDPNGNVNLAFYDRRLDPGDFLLWTWVARSSDGGASFVNHPASDVGWNHLPTEFPSFIGDYIDCDADAHQVIPMWCDGRNGSQDVYTDRMNINLFTDISTISVTTGGAAALNLNIGPNYGGMDYWVLGSVSGTEPGVTFGSGVHLPLSWDLFSTFTVTAANSPVLPNTRGTLDGTGSASAGFDTLGPLDAGLAGVEFQFSAVVFDGPPVYATWPTTVTLTP